MYGARNTDRYLPNAFQDQINHPYIMTPAPYPAQPQMRPETQSSTAFQTTHFVPFQEAPNQFVAQEAIFQAREAQALQAQAHQAQVLQAQARQYQARQYQARQAQLRHIQYIAREAEARRTHQAISREMVPPQAENIPTVSMLANASVQEQKKMLKDVLLPIIHRWCPALATEVAFMLLDYETAELLLMLEYPEILKVKVEEAISQLQAYRSEGILSFAGGFKERASIKKKNK